MRKQHSIFVVVDAIPENIFLPLRLLCLTNSKLIGADFSIFLDPSNARAGILFVCGLNSTTNPQAVVK
jgi:hypothetical protein